MIVKLTMKDNEIMKILFNNENYDIDFSNNDKDIFYNLNKAIVENIQKIENLIFFHNFLNDEEKKKVKYKVAFKIANTYLEEINKIKERLSLKKIELEEKIINE